jgi:hypothetical protein
MLPVEPKTATFFVATAIGPIENGRGYPRIRFERGVNETVGAVVTLAT